MGVRNFARSFAAVDGEVANLHLEAEWYSVNSTQIDTPTRGPLQLSHRPAPYQSLEGIGRGVPGPGAQQDQTHKYREQQIVSEPAPTRLGAGLAHRNWAPESGGPVSVRIRLPERRSCSQATNIWFIFCCVSNSLIFGVTSARGTCAAPDCRSCGRSS